MYQVVCVSTEEDHVGFLNVHIVIYVGMHVYSFTHLEGESHVHGITK